MTRILVTGGSSVVGDYLLPRLAAAGHVCTVLSRAPRAEPGWRRMDAARERVWDDSQEGTIALIHLAPLTLLPRVLPDAPASLQRVVAIGTTSVYTKGESRSAKDRELVQQQRAAEQVLTEFCTARGIVYTLFRPTLVYDGLRDKNVARIARLILAMGFFPVAAPGRGLRQPLHADDLAAACVAALEARGSRAYELGGGEVLSYRAMLERIFQALGRPPRVLPLPVALYRAAIAAARLLPRYRSLTPAVADRMNQDMVFDSSAAMHDFGLKPRAFAPGIPA
ncbi:MAG TPA: NAD-dependent epimerase/dehydratase family protein [Gammaproteobacteria bacterium]|jgi:nucleoside-diphosphate-sugar epimerase|nr:NAD-dependent epimerase/dehydratase family protein [Gammaproteobacteria bacterium]